MRALAAVLSLAVAVPLAQASDGGVEAAPTATQLLERMDGNLTFEARRMRAVMTVTGRRTRTYEMVTYGRGEEDSAVEYVSPPREKGTRMLKLGDELWIYMPTVERVQKISGHMLRQGMMGSDVSYEDLMASRELEKLYVAKVTGEGEVDCHECWKLELTANDKTVSYPKRVSWVDKAVYIPRKQELYALSGMLMKTWTMGDIQKIEGRWVAMKMVIADQLKVGSSTTLAISEVHFGVPLEEEVFSLRWLERK